MRHYEFTSPNNKYNVVIEEISSLYGSNINFYKRKNPFAVDYLRASFPTYRDLSPLRKNLYRQKWRGNTFIFEGRNFHKKNGEWQRIEIDLENDEGVEKTERIDPMGNIIPEDKQSDKNNTNPTNHINSSNTKKYDKKKIIENYLKDISKYTIVEIPNTNYKIIEVDRVVASSLWYFVEKVDNKIIFISELPDSSPQVEGKIDSKEIIHLTFKDIHDNITKYKSSDKGKNWVEYK
ncbi:hypothetical protein [Helcococcus kunzii]|uniref:hypothetical protein n=1 Tax=Helcococcus kunzii TaxID=40091 RepID=UPI0024AD92C1|nr:hypothetical protein [Helcococcus kunzii]